MKLTMLVNTFYRGKRYRTGDATDMDEATAARWCAGGIAAAAEDEAGDSGNEGKLDSLTVEKLKEYAADKGIDIDGLNKKADILGAIKAAEADPTNY